jgi:hypothetical protein
MIGNPSGAVNTKIRGRAKKTQAKFLPPEHQRLAPCPEALDLHPYGARTNSHVLSMSATVNTTWSKRSSITGACGTDAGDSAAYGLPGFRAMPQS